jgi:hypothetical protein
MPDVAVLSNRLTEALGVRHPIVSAPMAFAAGGALAAAVTRGGGLGLIGGGYGNAQWLDEQFIAASDERVGIGFITWSLARRPELLKYALRRKPVAVMLSFGDPREFAAEIHASGAVLICQCQTSAMYGTQSRRRQTLLSHKAVKQVGTARPHAAPSHWCRKWPMCSSESHLTRCSWQQAESPTGEDWLRLWPSAPTASS